MTCPISSDWSDWMNNQVNYYNNTKIILKTESNTKYILVFDFSNKEHINISLILNDNNPNDVMEVYSTKITEQLLSNHFSEVQIRSSNTALYKLFGHALEKLEINFNEAFTISNNTSIDVNTYEDGTLILHLPYGLEFKQSVPLKLKLFKNSDPFGPIWAIAIAKNYLEKTCSNYSTANTSISNSNVEGNVTVSSGNNDNKEEEDKDKENDDTSTGPTPSLSMHNKRKRNRFLF